MDTKISSNSAELPTQIGLPALRPLFFPHPFTPSHPIFVYMASIAITESQNLRRAAEQRIADLVKAETASVEASERSLRHQVEVFWTTYKNHLNVLQLEGEPRKQTSNAAPISRGGFGPGLGAISSSTSIRNFDPAPICPPLSPPLSPGPRIVSTLSASLATSTFHHLNTNEAHTNSESYSESSGYCGSASSLTISTYSKSPMFVPASDAVPVTNVLQYKRDLNDDINTQASYRYFVNLEEDMTRYKRSQEAAMKEQEAEASKRAQQAPTQAGSSGINTNGDLKKYKTVVQATKAQITTEDGSARHEETGERDKGKRKVTFNVEPTVMTIEMEADGNVEEDVTTEQDSAGMFYRRPYMKFSYLDVLQNWSSHLRT
jgi:hypothetical protein